MDGSGSEGALAEFAALRSEMDARSKFQQQILALQLTLTSAIVAFGLSRAGLVGILLIVPLSSYLLCGRYVGQRTSMRWSAKYIDTQLSPRVEGGLNWVRWSARNRRPARLLDWFLPLLICFPGAGALALGWTVHLVVTPNGRSEWTTAALVTVWVVGAFATIVSIYLLAGVLRRDRSAGPPAAANAVGAPDQGSP